MDSASPIITRQDVMGAMPPPTGVVPNFSDPEYIGSQILVINIIFLLLATGVIALRIYCRFGILHNVGFEDCALFSCEKESYVANNSQTP
jgi:hypothetical protein